MNVTTIGIDLAKNVFQVHGVDPHGRAVLRKQLKRAQLLPFFSNLPACLIGVDNWCRGNTHQAGSKSSGVSVNGETCT